MSKHGHTDRLVALQRGRSIAPAGCAAVSLMTNRRSGISGWLQMQQNSSVRSNELTAENAPAPKLVWEHFHTTTCLTTTAFGGRGNSGEKSAGEQVFRSGKGQMVFLHM